MAPEPTTFSQRHIGLTPAEVSDMAAQIGCRDMEELIEKIVPSSIRSKKALRLPAALSEEEGLAALRQTMSRNRVARSFLGLGYHDTFTPPVIQRNLLENPGWYTAYTPYQAEISEGRLGGLVKLPDHDPSTLRAWGCGQMSSLLDEGTAVAEACHLALGGKGSATAVFISDRCHPHVIDVVRTRMEPLQIEMKVGDIQAFRGDDNKGVAAVVAGYPDTLGRVDDLQAVADEAHKAGALFVVTADLLVLTLLKPPGEFGADICVGNSQRFGVPLGFGGPHAAFMAVKDALKRRLPGRLVGVSKDSQGNPGFRLSLQTREQHIRREKATSNICTAQVLLAVIASMYAVWHGPEGLKAIAKRVHGAASWLAKQLQDAGLKVTTDRLFDTLCVTVKSADEVIGRALAGKYQACAWCGRPERCASLSMSASRMRNFSPS